MQSPALPKPQNVFTVKLYAPDMDALLDLIATISGQLDDPDRIAAIRVDDGSCCAEIDVANRPVDARRLH